MKTKLARCILALLLSACFATNAADTTPRPGSDQSILAPSFSDKSLYLLESLWTNDDGKQIRLAQLKGRPQIVAMFFTSCQYACPLIVNDMKRIETALPESVRTNVGCTLVSFDTRRDTVAVLAEYRRMRALPAGRWTLLRGNSDDVLELAAVLGVRCKQDANGQFSHSNVITILNSQGEIAHQQVGLNQDIRGTVRIIENLLAK